MTLLIRYTARQHTLLAWGELDDKDAAPVKRQLSSDDAAAPRPLRAARLRSAMSSSAGGSPDSAMADGGGGGGDEDDDEGSLYGDDAFEELGVLGIE